MELVVVLAVFALLAILGPLVGVDNRGPGGWTPTEPDGKIWPDRAVMPDRSSEPR